MQHSGSALPAILGGKAAVTFDQSAATRWPMITAEDESSVLAVMRQGDLSFNPVTQQLERDYCDFTGRRYVLAHCNGTAALLAAFFALGLEPGDEVLVPSATFWASVVPMLWVGAVPVFCESEPDRLGLDPADAEAKITSRTRALMMVHLWGMPSKTCELIELARRHNLKLIEDASHALGASVDGRKCGSFGDISVFSLQSGKLAPAGEGGIFLTDNETYWERATCLGDMERTLRLTTPARRFAGTTFGIKTRLAPVCAAIARVQLKRLEERNARRRENMIYLSRKLQAFGLQTYLEPPGVTRVYLDFLLRYDAGRFGLPINHLVDALVAEGCLAATPRYPLLHQQPLFTEGHFRRIARLPDGLKPPAYDPRAMPRTEALAREFIRLPAFPWASRELLDQYATGFEKVLTHCREIAAAVKVTGQLQKSSSNQNY